MHKNNIYNIIVQLMDDQDIYYIVSVLHVLYIYIYIYDHNWKQASLPINAGGLGIRSAASCLH